MILSLSWCLAHTWPAEPSRDFDSAVVVVPLFLKQKGLRYTGIDESNICDVITDGKNQMSAHSKTITESTESPICILIICIRYFVGFNATQQTEQ